MACGLARLLWRDQCGAIAPLYALVFFGLVGMVGVGFDFGRMMAMDSELQNAADQAALAAVSQLNGQTDAMSRATDAAQDAFATAASEWVNVTRLSNVDDDGDGNPQPITGLTFRFYADYDYDAEAPTGELDPETDPGEDARVVTVIVNGRRLFYALTPVVGAFSSGDITAAATATLQKASCDVVPFMFCAPSTGFGSEEDRGKGMRLHMLANASDLFAPGNFGFLDIDYNTKGNPNRRLGINTQGGICIGEEIESDPGNRASEVPPFNTRFDRYENSANGLNCNSDGDFCAAENVRQSYVQVQTFNNRVTPTADCAATPTNNGAWTTRPEGGYPKESCIAAGTCSFGSGTTDADWSTYMARNHPGVDVSTIPTTGDGLTRYDVYNWERDNNRLGVVKVASTATRRNNGRYDVTNYCSYPTPRSTPFVPDVALNQKDRRVLTVAAVDCTGLNGRDVVKIQRWVDIFLVDSANTTGSDKEFIAEVIGPAARPDGASGFQNFGRGKAVLIR
jgi:hypothetical protein